MEKTTTTTTASNSSSIPNKEEIVKIINEERLKHRKERKIQQLQYDQEEIDRQYREINRKEQRKCNTLIFLCCLFSLVFLIIPQEELFVNRLAISGIIVIFIALLAHFFYI